MNYKQEFLQNLTKTYQENIWKDEIQIMEFKELLGSKRTELASIDLKLERKEFKSAGEGRKAHERTTSDIEAIKAAIEKLKGQKVNWQKRIELIARYASGQN